MIRYLQRGDRLRAALLRQVIETLEIRSGARLLDIGCGIGLQALQLVGRTRPGSQLIGLDISRALLAYAKEKKAATADARQISFTQGDMGRLPFADGSFDLCWSVDCLGYPAADSLPLLKEAARAAREGATVAVLAWTSQSVLPGHAMLEARLNASASAYGPLLSQAKPEQHFMRLGKWFEAAGIREARCRSFIGEVSAPLDGEQRGALADLFEMLWQDGLRTSSADDQAEYARLCRPDSPDCVLDLPDYCAFFTYTMFSGIVRR